ncbi:MAG: hypothetical protein JJT76_03555 [Clostridiaceae bacterium]|nr:hypothetical protein [Clostridiaceae bacterium]
MRKLPKSLMEKQEKQRLESINKVQQAIDELKSLGYDNIKTGMLIERTGLSRATFSKPHIIEVLKDNKIGRFKDAKVIKRENHEKNYRNMVIMIENELQKSHNKARNLQKDLDAKKLRIETLEVALEKEKIKNQKLIGEMQILYKKLKIFGLGTEL